MSNEIRPSCPNPMVDPDLEYILKRRSDGNFMVDPWSHIVTDDPANARPYCGDYLNGTAWSWSTEFEAVLANPTA